MVLTLDCRRSYFNIHPRSSSASDHFRIGGDPIFSIMIVMHVHGDSLALERPPPLSVLWGGVKHSCWSRGSSVQPIIFRTE